MQCKYNNQHTLAIEAVSFHGNMLHPMESTGKMLITQVIARKISWCCIGQAGWRVEGQ